MFIDEFSNWVTVIMKKKKSEAPGNLLEYEKYAERQIGQNERVLRLKRGGEYISKILTLNFKHQKIVHELITGYSLHQSRIAEKSNCRCLNMVWSMLCHRSVPELVWAQALSTAKYIRNQVSSRAPPSDKTHFHF